MEPTTGTARIRLRLFLSLAIASISIVASAPVSAAPVLKLKACLVTVGCGVSIEDVALVHFTHENGFGQSTDPFPDDVGNGMSNLPEFPAAELFYSGTLTALASPLGSSMAEFGGRYEITPGPTNFDTFRFLAPSAGLELDQTDLDANPNEPALMAGTLGVPVWIVSGSGQIQVTSTFDITTTVPGTGTATVELTICAIKNWLDAPSPGFPKSASDCSGLGDLTTRTAFPTYTATVSGTGTLSGTHTVPVTLADQNNWWWLVYFLDVEVANDSDPTSVVIDAIDIEILSQDNPPVPSVSSLGLMLIGVLVVGFGALALILGKHTADTA